MELRESPAGPAADTNTCSGEPSLTLDSSHGSFITPWNTSAGVWQALGLMRFLVVVEPGVGAQFP